MRDQVLRSERDAPAPQVARRRARDDASARKLPRQEAGFGEVVRDDDRDVEAVGREIGHTVSKAQIDSHVRSSPSRMRSQCAMQRTFGATCLALPVVVSDEVTTASTASRRKTARPSPACHGGSGQGEHQGCAPSTRSRSSWPRPCAARGRSSVERRGLTIIVDCLRRGPRRARIRSQVRFPAMPETPLPVVPFTMVRFPQPSS